MIDDIFIEFLILLTLTLTIILLAEFGTQWIS